MRSAHSSRVTIYSLSLLLVLFTALPLSATSVVPVSDSSLYDRADVVVHGVVKSSEVKEDPQGRPETVTVIEPIEIVKGGLAGDLVLHQAGGTLPDGRFFKLWGRPEYTPGHEVIVFAISRPEGDFQTAEMMMGKFEVRVDEQGTLFAESSLSGGEISGVSVHPELRVRSNRSAREISLDSTSAPRELSAFTSFLKNGAIGDEPLAGTPSGVLRPARKAADSEITGQWTNLNSQLWRYTNNATAAWALDGAANITGGGTAEAQRALASWTNEPNTSINYTLGGSNPIHLSALSSPCGWSTALPPELGVIGCGGPNGGGSNSWRGENYNTITGGEVWLRAYSSLNQVGSVVTESVLLHELGHTLGLGHSDQGTSAHDVCPGDEGSATMRSTVQSRTTLGTDDVDAVRWLYGDGGSSCSAPPPCVSPTISSQPRSSTISAGGSVTLTVSATGATSYQWYVGTSGNTSFPVSGATASTLQVSPASTTNYWVRAINSCGSVNSATSTVTVNVPSTRRVKTPADFNGDRISDLVLYRDGAWISFTPGIPGVWTGQSSANCIPAPADYDGDGRTDYAMLCNGAYNIFNADGSFRKSIWTGGVAGDLPVPADYDGNGADEVVIFRGGAWIGFDYNSGAQIWGVWTGPGPNTIPAPMDYDGDGRADFTVYARGPWHFYNRDGSYRKGIWTGGVAGDIPVPGDYNGDGIEEPVIFRGGAWLFYDFSTGVNTRGVWTGVETFNRQPLQPAPLDFDGDGSVDFTVFPGGPWHLFNDNGTYNRGVWTGGVPGDQAASRRQQTTW